MSTVFYKLGIFGNMETKNMLKRRMAGVTLIEALMVIGVALALSTVGYNLYQKAQEGNKTNKTINEISQVQQAIGRMYQSNPNVSAIANSVLSTANAWPTTMVSSGAGTAAAVIKNGFGGDVAVAPSTGAAPLNTTNFYQMTFTALPQQACVDIVNAVSSNYYQVTVNGTTVKTVSQASASPSDVTTACNSLSANSIVLHGKP